jgi:hypothetical protein
MIAAATNSGTIEGTNILETSPYLVVPFEQLQDQLWHPLYFQTDGDSIQIEISLSDLQMKNTDIVYQPFELNAMILYTQPTSRRL